MNTDRMNRDLLRVIIEKNLYDLGPTSVEIIESRLKNDYNCTIGDCIDNPEYLKHILTELFGKGYKPLLNQIRKDLEESTLDPKLENFLSVLERD